MTKRLPALATAILAALAWATPASADTCCANVPVRLDPPAAMPGDTVRLDGMECRNADNSGPLPLNLGSFWLATTNRPAEVDPDTTPGEGLPEMPPVEEWLAFDSVADGDAGAAVPGTATITVPDLPDGRYQLWWWCDNGSGPGGGIHYFDGAETRGGPRPRHVDRTGHPIRPDRWVGPADPTPDRPRACWSSWRAFAIHRLLDAVPVADAGAAASTSLCRDQPAIAAIDTDRRVG